MLCFSPDLVVIVVCETRGGPDSEEMAGVAEAPKVNEDMPADVKRLTRVQMTKFQTKTPLNSALLPTPAPCSCSHCTSTRSTTQHSSLPLRLSFLTRAQLST